MSAHPESIEEWCHLVPHLLLSEGWQHIAEEPSSFLSHCSCPWGGSLVKTTFLDVTVADPPEDPARILVRPESRAWGASTFIACSPEYFALEEQLAPGDAIVHRWASWKVLRLFAVLFGEIGTQLAQTHFYHPEMAVQLRMRSRRNYPQKGDSSQTVTSLSEPFEAVNFCRPTDVKGCVDIYHIFRVPTDLNLSQWAAAQFHGALESGRRVTHHYLNRPGIPQIRAFDEQFYVVLTMQSFKRGAPLLPAQPDEREQVTKIDAGQAMGLTKWVRYEPAMAGGSAFHLSEYLRLFAERIGESCRFYQSLDGQELLYFQCVVARDEWVRVQGHIRSAYLLQKTAYRRANGGAQAPGLSEGVKPRFCQEIDLSSLAERIQADSAARPQQKVQVRNTFVEVDVDEEESDEEELPIRSCRRHKTAAPASLDSCIGVA